MKNESECITENGIMLKLFCTGEEVVLRMTRVCLYIAKITI